jgi:hypothetical protein
MRRVLPWLCLILLVQPHLARAAVGDPLGEVLQRPWLQGFGLRESGRQPWLGGSWVVRLAPPLLSRAHGQVLIEVATDCERRVLSWTVLLDRAWLDGADRRHALALLAAVLEEAGPDPSDGLMPVVGALRSLAALPGAASLERPASRNGHSLPDPRTPTETADAEAMLTAVAQRWRAGTLTTRWLHVAARTEPAGASDRLRVVVQARPDVVGGSWCR